MFFRNNRPSWVKRDQQLRPIHYKNKKEGQRPIFSNFRKHFIKLALSYKFEETLQAKTGKKLVRNQKRRIGSQISGFNFDQAMKNHSFLSFCVSVGLMDAAMESPVNAEDNVIYET